MPAEINRLLNELDAPPRLIAHLTLVHDVAATLCEAIGERWPQVGFDRAAVLFGAATHDIGKVKHRGELSGAGDDHERAGRELLEAHGIPAAYARFAFTHGNWQDSDSTIEDLLVALADKVWKGKREERLELRLAERIAAATGEQTWQVYVGLDDILRPIADDADRRLAWQSSNDC